VTEFKPHRRANGEMIVDIGPNYISDREYFGVKDGVNALQREDPIQHRALMDAARANKSEQTNKIWGEIRERHPEIHAKIIGQNAGEIVGHIASGQPVKPMLEVNGRPFSPRVIEGEISASIRDSSATRAAGTHLDDVRQNTLRLTGPGKVEGAFHVDAVKAVTLLGDKHVHVANDGASAKVSQHSMLSRHPAGVVAAADAQIMSKLMHDAGRAAGNNLVIRALMAGGAMVAAGAASAMDAPEGQRLETGVKAALKAGAEHAVPGIMETDKCVAQGKAWGNVGATLGGLGVTAGAAYVTGGVSLLGGVATATAGAMAGDKIGSFLGEGVCRLAQSAASGVVPEHRAMTAHKPTTKTVASNKVPDTAAVAQATPHTQAGRS
jgi:hypothetical protein